MRTTRRVLVISSDSSLASELERPLGRHYEVHAAATGEATATLLAERHTYACLVVDVRPTAMAQFTVKPLISTGPPLVVFSDRDEDYASHDVDVVVACDRYVERLVHAIERATSR